MKRTLIAVAVLSIFSALTAHATTQTQQPAKQAPTIKSYVSSSTVLGSTTKQCVPWARDNGKSNLPYGLNTYKNKVAIINKSSPAAGYAAIINVSNNGVGHVALVDAVNSGGNGRAASITLREANWVSGKYSTRVGYGATLADAQRVLNIAGYFN